jgi:hypothetical protein
MYNTLVAMYIYGIACIVGGFYIGILYKGHKDENGDGV